MQGWRIIWTVFCTVGLIAFALLVIAIVPRGAIELKDFFAKLKADSDTLGRDNHQ